MLLQEYSSGFKLKKWDWNCACPMALTRYSQDLQTARAFLQCMGYSNAFTQWSIMERVSASAVNWFPQVDFTWEEIVTLNVICEEQHHFFICLERVCSLIRHWLSRLQRTALKLTTEANFCFTSQEHLSPWHGFNSVVK